MLYTMILFSLFAWSMCVTFLSFAGGCRKYHWRKNCRDKSMFCVTKLCLSRKKRHPDGSSPAFCEVHTEEASGTSSSQRIGLHMIRPWTFVLSSLSIPCVQWNEITVPLFWPKSLLCVIISSSANGAGLLRNVLLNETPKFHYISCSLGVLAGLGVLWHSPNRAITSLLLFACYNVIHEASGVRWTDGKFPKGLWQCAMQEGT